MGKKYCMNRKMFTHIHKSSKKEDTPGEVENTGCFNKQHYSNKHMDSIHHPKISVILKNGTWVPKKQKILSTIEHRGLELKKVLGQGAFAKVKLAFSQKENKNVAVKLFDKRRLPTDYMKKFLPREIKVLALLQHPHLITLRDIFETGKFIYMVLEYAAGGDLLEYINQGGYQNEAEILRHFQQIVCGLACLHRQSIVHRDLKCENILLDESNNIKIGDFGFARLVDTESLLSTLCGSFAYSAPELIAGKSGYSGFLTDCWSLGVILYCMLCRKLPYDKEELLALSRGRIYQVKALKFNEEIPDDAITIIKGLLEIDPLKRLTCADLLKAEWCKGYRVIQQATLEQVEMSSDIIGAKTTIATSTQPRGVTNILSDIIRPNFRKTFVKAIKRQRANILAISAFNKIKNIKPIKSENEIQKTPSCVLSHSVLSAPKNRRRFSLVTELNECQREISNEKRRQKDAESTVIKDVSINLSKNKTKSRFISMSESQNTPISSEKYEEFLRRQKTEKETELQNLSRFQSSRLARRAIKHKHQIDKSKKKANEHWFEAETGNDKAKEEWVRKCILSCPSRKN